MKKQASLLDYSYPGLSADIYQADGTLLPYHKDYILKLINAFYTTYKLKNPEAWVLDITNIGSLTTNKYLRSSDFDCHVIVDIDAFQKTNMPEASREEAALYLDNARKEWDRAKILLPFGEHPLELYFESQESPSNTKAVGRYSLMSNTWLKEPVFFAQDDDYEVSKQKIVEQAIQMANELDASFGNIRRDIKRIDELKEVANAWPAESRKLYLTKIEDKLNSIEEEIETAIALRQELIDERHEKQDPFSENEIKFKYLARFFYFYIIDELKTIVAGSGGTVTETELPLIKNVVASSAIQDINGVRVYRNPQPEQALNLFRHSKEQCLRYIATEYGDIYMWDAFDVEHSQMAEDIGLTEDPNWYDGAGTIISEKQAYERAKTFTASLKTAGQVIDVNGVRVFQNPSLEQVKKIFQNSKDLVVRYIIDPNSNDLFIWDAYHLHHMPVMEALGIEWSQETYDNFTGTISSNDDIESLFTFWQEGGGQRKAASKHDANKDLLIDFDGTIAEKAEYPEMGKPMPGVQEAFAKFKDLGYTIIIYTCRSNHEDGVEQVEKYLDENKIPYDMVFEGEKPHAKFYIDDKAIHFNSWDKVTEKVEKSKKTASASILKVEPYGGGVEFPVFVNPTKQQVYNLIKKWNINEDENLRVIHGNNIYVWEARQATHDHVLEYLTDQGLEEHSNVQTGYIFGKSDVGEWFWKNAFLHITAYRQKKLWFDPNGKKFDVPLAHADWIIDNRNFLEKNYGFDSSEWERLDDGSIPDFEGLDSALIDEGWSRVGDIDAGWGIEVANLRHIPEYLLNSVSGSNGEVTFEDTSRNWVIVDVDDFMTYGQKAVNKALQQKRLQNAASLQRKAGLGTKYWIDPSGKEIEVPIPLGHYGWITKNQELLQTTYNFEFPQEYWEKSQGLMEIGDLMIQNGWTRITTESDYDFAVEVADLNNLPSYLDNFVAQHYTGGGIEIDDLSGEYQDLSDPFPTLRKAIYQARRLRQAASLKEASNLSHAYWVDPAGKIYTVRPNEYSKDLFTHSDWVVANQELLKEQYGLTLDLNCFKIIKEMYAAGWARIGDSGRSDMGYGITVGSLSQIPEGVDIALAQFYKGEELIVEGDSDGKTVFVDDPFPNLQQAVNKALSQQRMGSLKTAGYDHAYWLDPNGKIFQVRGADATGASIDRGDSSTHSQWILENLDMLQKDYGIDPKSLSGTSRSLVELGWTRIGDAYGTDWGIDVTDTNNIPSFIDDTIAQFAPEGAMITVAGPGSARYSPSGFTFEWPVKSIQQTVQQLKNRQSQKPSPTLQQAAALITDPKHEDRQGPPYALFAFTQEGLPEYGIPALDMYNIFGDHPRFGSTVSKKTVEDLGIPIRQEKQAQTKKIKQGEYGALMALVPHNIAQEIVEWGVRNIPDKVVFSSEDNPRLGRELESHITIKYGLLTEDAKNVRRFFNETKPFKAKLGKVRHFEPPEMDFDVVTVEVISEDLNKMNGIVTEKFECAEGLVSDDYHPHITISYVKRGTGKDYVGATDFEGTEVELDTVIFSPAKGNRTYFKMDVEAGLTIIWKLQKKAYPEGNWAESAWISPNGEVEEFDDMSHEDMIYELMGDSKIYDTEDPNSYAISKGWTRFGEMGGGGETGANVKSLRNINPAVFNHAMKYTGQNKQMVIADLSGAYVQLPVDEFVLGQKAVDKALQHKRLQGSLHKKAFESRLWVDPKGEIYSTEGDIHYSWVNDNLEFLAEKYGFKLPKKLLNQRMKYYQLVEQGEENLDLPDVWDIVEAMYQSGWVRIGDPSAIAEIGIELQDLRKIPSFLDGIVARFLNDGTHVMVEDRNRQSVVVTYPFQSLQQAANKALSSPTKTAATRGPIFIWLSPDGKEYDTPQHSHGAWVEENKEMLAKEYGLTRWALDWGTGEDVSWLISKGWTRVTGYLPSEIDLNVADINNVPQAAENYVWKHKPEVAIIEDLNGNDDSFDQEEYSKGFSKKAAHAPFSGKAWRGMSMGGFPPGTSAADVIRYEAEELGNDNKVDPKLIPLLEKRPASDLIWVTKNKEDALKYGNPQPVEIGPNAVIIGQDEEGGYLLLKSAALDKSADFLPSFVQAPDNDWQFAEGGPDKEIPVDPDAQSDEQTDMAPCTTGKPRKLDMWKSIWHMIKSPFSKKDVEKESAADPEQEKIEQNELGEDETLLEYSKGFKDLNRENTNKPKTTWDAGPSKAPNQQEPYSPLPVTLDVVTNPDNENWRYPYKFTRRPVGDQSNQGEVTQALEDMFKSMTASLHKESKVIEIGLPYVGAPLKVIVNPTRNEALGALKRTEHGLRYLVDDEANTFIWNSWNATHTEVAGKLVESGYHVSNTEVAGFLEHEGDVEEMFGTLGKKASIEEAFGVPVLVNPSPQEVKGMQNKSEQHILRALVDPETGDIYVWDAWASEHNAIIRYFGLPIDWETDDGTYIRHVHSGVDAESDISYLFELQSEIRNKLSRKRKKTSIQKNYALYVGGLLMVRTMTMWKAQKILKERYPEALAAGNYEIRPEKYEMSIFREALYSNTYTDEQGEQFYNEQHMNNTDEEPYVNHDQRDYPGGTHDSPENTDSGIGWAKDNTRQVVLLDQLLKPCYRQYAPGLPEYQVFFFDTMPMSDGSEV